MLKQIKTVWWDMVAALGLMALLLIAILTAPAWFWHTTKECWFNA